MKRENIKLAEIVLTHRTEECDGCVVPKFLVLTSEGCLRVYGYCLQCYADLSHEFHLAELQKLCPEASAPTKAKRNIAPQQPQPVLLEDFEPPAGSKPN